MISLKRKAVCVACGAFLAFFSMGPCAQDFPARPISIVVPAAPGGTVDINARPLAQVLTRLLGQSVIVVNRPGAGGAVGAAFVANAKPDGYTLLMPLPTASAIPVADQLAGRKPSFSMEQFSSIALISADPNLLGTRVSAPWRGTAVPNEVRCCRMFPPFVSLVWMLSITFGSGCLHPQERLLTL